MGWESSTKVEVSFPNHKGRPGLLGGSLPRNNLALLFSILKGGPGSGNIGHAGIPGHRGGSSPKGGGFGSIAHVNQLGRIVDAITSSTNAQTKEQQTKKFLDSLGFTGKPKVVSEKDLDKTVSAGSTEMFRSEAGANAERYAEQFRNGEMNVGSGFYASDIHFAHGEGAREHALHFVSNTIKNGVLTRAALSKDAKIITEDKLQDLQSSLKKDLDSNMTSLIPTENIQAIVEYSKNSNKVYDFLSKDLGRLASSAGYDAIQGPDGTGGLETIVLNRGKVIVSSESEKI